MSNATVIRRMLQIVDDYAVGQRSSIEVERQIENHMQALERIELSDIHASRQLTYLLVCARFSAGVDVFGSQEGAAVVRLDIRNFLRSLPGAQGADQ